MTKKQIEYRVNEIVKLDEQIKELQERENRYKEDLEKEMKALNTESMDVRGRTVRYQPIQSSRFDSKTLKCELPDVWNKYNRVSNYYRFSIS